MQFPELEQFLGRGEEKVWWRLSLLNAGGALLGFFIGQRAGELAGLRGPVLIGLALVVACVGIWATSKRRGVIRAQRTWLWLRWAVLRRVQPRVIDAAELYAVVVEDTPVVRHRRDGATVLRSGRPTRTGSARNGKG